MGPRRIRRGLLIYVRRNPISRLTLLEIPRYIQSE